MKTVTFILFALTSSADGETTTNAPVPTAGANLVAPARATVEFSAGINTILPTLSLAAATGITDWLDVTLRYDVHAGLSHDFGARLRARFADGWAASLTVAEGFFVVEEIDRGPQRHLERTDPRCSVPGTRTFRLHAARWTNRRRLRQA